MRSVCCKHSAEMSGSIFKYSILTLLLFIGCLCADNAKDEPFTPIVLWHGMGDSCCFPFSLGAITKRLTESLPGVYVVSLKIGKSIVNDVENGYFMHPDKQIEMACQMIKNDGKLANGFNAIGLSQGAQFLRGLVQRCPSAKVRNLISLGGQHQGVYGLPNCGSLSGSTCDYVRRLLNHAAYFRWVQKTLVQATYWHDPLNENEYKNYSTFLADINNENEVNQDYVDRLQNLEHLVLVKFDNDTIVQPAETEWFGFYKPGQSQEIQSLQDSDLYTEDRLGLKSLDNQMKLQFSSTPGNHLQFDWPWFEQNILNPYLKN